MGAGVEKDRRLPGPAGGFGPASGDAREPAYVGLLLSQLVTVWLEKEEGFVIVPWLTKDMDPSLKEPTVSWEDTGISLVTVQMFNYSL